jgi:Tol biopolymer transport system component
MIPRGRRALPALAVLVLFSLSGCFSGLGSQQGAPNLKATQASYSPDGSRIVFVSLSSGEAQIYLANADGGNVRQLTTGSTNAQPAWSPDGTKLLFNSNRGSPNGTVYELYVMNADGTEQKLIPLEIPTTK